MATTKIDTLFPSWDIQIHLRSDRGTYFTGTAVYKLWKDLSLTQKLNFLIIPNTLEKWGKKKKTLKLKLANQPDTIEFLWLKVLPLAYMAYIRGIH